MSTDPLPPCSTEYEQVVIGALLLDAKVAYPICVEALGEGLESFWDPRHRLLWECIGRMVSNGKPVQLVTVFQELCADGRIEDAGGIQYLATLPNRCASPHGVGYFCDVLVEYRQKRALLALSGKLSQAAVSYGDVQETLSGVTREIAKLSKPTRHETAIRQLVQEAIGEIEACHQSQGKLPGLSTGFPDLDRKVAGLHDGEMFVIAGRPGTGKTSLAMNIAEHVAIEQGVSVGVFSLEMTARSLVTRMVCSRARVNLRNVAEGFLADRDFPKLTGAAGKIANSPLHIDDSAGLSIYELQARAERMADQHKVRLLVVDYLQLMHGSRRRNDNRETEVAEMSGGCKAIAKSLNVPFIVLSQLNRDLERDKNRRPRLSDLRESGAIEQDADVVAFLWRSRPKGADEDEDDSQDAAPVTLTVAKQRNGPTGDVHLTFLKGYTRFESAAKVEEADVPSYDTD